MSQKLEAMIENLAEKIDNYKSQTDTRLLNVEKVLVALDINMETHMKRSDMLESLYNHIREKDLKEIREEIKPIQTHVSHVEGALKLLGTLALIVTIVGGFAKLFNII